MYKIYVITLAYSDAGEHTSVAKTMLGHTLRTCQQHNWKADIFHAVNGYKLNPEIWTTSGVKEPKTKKLGGQKFSDKPGAQGCFLSHFSLWKMCVDYNEPIVILEDDVKIIGPMPKIKTKFDLLKLHAPRQRKEHQLVGEWSPGAFAYWLSPAGAQKLIDFAKHNGAKYSDKCIGSKVLDWTYLENPIVQLIRRYGSSTNPEKYPYVK